MRFSSASILVSSTHLACGNNGNVQIKKKKRGIEKIKRDANRGKKLDTYGIIFERDAFATRLFRANLIDSNVYLHIVRTVGRIEFASFDRVFDSK